MKKKLRYLILSILILPLSGLVTAQYFTPVWSGNGFNNMSIIIQSATIDGNNLIAGDSISVLDVDADNGNYICVGAGVVAQTITPGTPLIITASEEDETPQNGFIDGNSIKFIFWDDSESQIISLIDATFDTDFDVVYTGLGTAILNSLTGYSLNTWIGTTNDWNLSTNWSTGIANDQFSDTKIPATGVTNYPTLSADGECHNLLLEATSSGVGSLMDDGLLTVHGKATVETYLTNSAGAGNFWIHLIGPTVDEENYTGGGTGAFLSAFNIVPGGTYAYEYDEPTGDWPPLTSLTDEIRTCNGIGLSTVDNTDHTLSITGALVTGAVSSPSLTTGGTNFEMISNPYPSAIDFDALATANSGVVNNKNWIWNPAIGNYVVRSGGSGGSQYIQVGQGFFVETNASGTFDFTNTERTHNNTPFLKNEQVNVLTGNIEGGEYGFKDEMIIRFAADATPDYDFQIEAIKWYSMYDDATMIYSIAEDDTELAINVLPVGTLGIENVSVPVNFHCGYEDEYTLNFSGVETFDNNEIWLEDKKTGGDWIDLNQNPEYTFVGFPDDQNDRFEIHFYGPTGIIGNSASNSFQIYSSGQNVYVINNSKETIDKIQVYDLTGKLMMEERKLSQRTNKLTVDAKSGYYIVKVVTQISSYSNKVMIAIN